MKEFCHLHVHTAYSLLDGAARIPDLVRKAKEAGMTHLAMTDHGVMYGAVEFYNAAREAGITPIMGCEVYVAKNRLEKQGRADREYSHLVLLAENQTGYQNLLKLVSIGFLEGYYYKPRIDYEILSRYKEGLIALSACLAGDIPRLILEKQEDAAQALAVELYELMGEDRFYLELQDHGMAEQRRVNQALLTIHERTGIPLVATNDVHYINREDAFFQDVLMCIQMNRFLDEPDRLKMFGDQSYLKTGEEMADLFRHVPQALENTRRIAQRCCVTLDFNTHYLPEYQLPPRTDKAGYFRDLVNKGMRERYGETPGKEACDRRDFELGVITNMGYVDYFLVVWDFIRFARERGISVGPGRGSAAGSIVAYALYITDIDPLQYGLLFERFLNPDRISLPDIDVDFCYERRQEVIDYVFQKYGNDHVAQIITFGTMAARQAIRDVGRVMEMSYGEVDRIAKMIPFQPGITIESALRPGSDLQSAYEDDANVRQLVHTAKQLEGVPRHAGTHAAGVVISRVPLAEVVPLQKNEETITTQFTMGAVEQLGLLKVDFLGLRNLTVIQDAVKAILVTTGKEIDMGTLDFSDPHVYQMIGEGDTDGVFQLESAGMRQLLRDFRPTEFEDIIACISLYRPGPMDQIPKYVRAKKDPSSVTYTHEALRPILADTSGCMVYQEQVMRIFRDLAGFSLARSDLVRKAMSKKQRDVMQAEREAFLYGDPADGVAGAIKNGIDEQTANAIYDEMIDFAQYAFNKSHAAAYGVVAYRTAWLKYYYPVHYMAALMNSCMGYGSKISQYIAYCRKHGIEILPPDVNRSGTRFRAEGEKAIRFGMAALKNVGRKAIDMVIEERESAPFQSFLEFIQRIPPEVINKRMMESMILTGCFDSFGHNRTVLMAAYEGVMDRVAGEKKRNIEGQTNLFELIGETPDPVSEERYQEIPEYTLSEILEKEKEITGAYISGHPLMAYAEYVGALRYHTLAIEEGGQELDGEWMTLAGLVSHVRTRTTKNGTLMATGVLEDLYASVDVIFFAKAFDNFRELMQNNDSAYLLYGRISVREEEPPSLIVEECALLVPGSEGAERLMRRDRTVLPRRKKQGWGEKRVPGGGSIPGSTPSRPAEPPGVAVEKQSRLLGEDLPTFRQQKEGEGDCLWLRLPTFDNEFLVMGVLESLKGSPGHTQVKAVARDSNRRIRLNVTTELTPGLLRFLMDALGEENVKVVQKEREGVR